MWQTPFHPHPKGPESRYRGVHPTQGVCGRMQYCSAPGIKNMCSWGIHSCSGEIHVGTQPYPNTWTHVQEPCISSYDTHPIAIPVLVVTSSNFCEPNPLCQYLPPGCIGVGQISRGCIGIGCCCQIFTFSHRMQTLDGSGGIYLKLFFFN